MSEFVFVNNGADGKNILDLLNFFVQFGILFFAGYAVLSATNIYRKQKEEDKKLYEEQKKIDRGEDSRQMKINTLKDFVTYRFDLKGKEFSKALNEIPIAFHDSEDVIKKWNNFYVVISGDGGNFINEEDETEMSNKTLNSLFEEMCKDLNINLGKYTNDEFLKVFNKIS